MRGCGLKSIQSRSPTVPISVILRARMWIEISWAHAHLEIISVILRARMWIEITRCVGPQSHFKSSSVRGCGLKSHIQGGILFGWLLSSMRGCGLKCRHPSRFDNRSSHPLCEDVDWNRLSNCVNKGAMASSFVRGCGLKWPQRYGLDALCWVILRVRALCWLFSHQEHTKRHPFE